MGITTTLGFLALGFGLIAAAGPDAWPLRSVVGPSVRARLLRSFLPVTAAVVAVNDIIESAFRHGTDVNLTLVSLATAALFLLLISVVVSQVSSVIAAAIETLC